MLSLHRSFQSTQCAKLHAIDFGRALAQFEGMKIDARLTILGTGEAFDSGRGNNACLLHGTRRAGTVPCLLLDCGYQIPERLWALGRVYPRLDGIYLTHLHADHAFGVVPLLTRFFEERRTRPLSLIGAPGLSAYVRKLFALGYPNLYSRLGFELQFIEVRPGIACKWNTLELRVARSLHSVMNYSVRVEKPGGWSFGVSGDGEMTAETEALFDDVDLLFQEIYSDRPAPLHGNLGQLERFARRARISRVIGVTHHSRQLRARIAARVRELRQKDPRFKSLQPGMVFDLPATDRKPHKSPRSLRNYSED